MAEWRKYRCHKIVEAAPIVRIMERGDARPALFIRSGDGDTVERFDPSKDDMRTGASEGDYAIRYEDGYKSISPKAVFEDGYTLIEPTEPT